MQIRPSRAFRVSCVAMLLGVLAATVVYAASEWADGGKFNTGEGKTDKDGKCKGKEGSCYTDSKLKTGDCETFTTAKTCPLCSNTALSAKLVEITQWGECGEGASGDKCSEYDFFYCAKFDWFAEANGCANGSGATCTVAFGKPKACDPEPGQ